MLRFAWSQLLHRRGRVIALTVGILVAAVSFTMLTSAATTSDLQVRGTVAKNWRTAYDILVRPTGSFTQLERSQGLVAANYLSGIVGGITIAQWRAVLHLPGVQVAAPVANLGYVIPMAVVTLPLAGVVNGASRQLYRIRLTWRASGGSAAYQGSIPYVYVTRVAHDACPDERFGGPAEPSSPFEILGPSRSYLTCFDRDSEGEPFVRVDAPFPVLVAAIDPTQENRLLALDRTIVEGRGLRPGDTATATGLGSVIPVIASTRTYVDEFLQATVERLPAVDVPSLLREHRAYQVVSTLPSTTVARQTVSPSAMYGDLLRQLERTTVPFISQYWTSGPVTYRIAPGPVLAAVPRDYNADVVWSYPQGLGGFFPAPPGSEDVQLRDLTAHRAVLNPENAGDGSVSVVGRFDPAKLPGFSPLSSVPLESYYPPLAEPADAPSRVALGGGPLMPSMNLGGYLAQPPLMLTTIGAAGGLTDSRFFQGADTRAPISVIRVKVAGVTGPDPVSRERVRRVAMAIREATGLSVDITAGSSPQSVLVRLPASRFGTPSLLVREGWVKKGVALVFLQALDRKSVSLFVLVLLVCVFFLANASFASVRVRRQEIGTLRCLGWTKGRVFGAVLAEVAIVGLVAGLVGTAIAIVLVKAMSLSVSLDRLSYVTPVAVVLAVSAGLYPARRAARAAPIDAVQPEVAGQAAHRAVGSIAGMAVVNLRRLPGRTLLGAAGLFVGVAALSALISIDLAFQGMLAGTVLGAFISLQVRGVDYLSVALAIALGGFSVADVLVLNVRERAPELVTLRTLGWTVGDVRRLVLFEGLGIGVLGSVLGAFAGVGLAAVLGEGASRLAEAALAAAVAGVAVALLASAVSASLVARMTPPQVLSGEW